MTKFFLTMISALSLCVASSSSANGTDEFGMSLRCLSAITALGGRPTTIAIHAEIERRLGVGTSLQGVYSCLTRLRKAGSVTRVPFPARPVRGGRGHYGYELTRDGRTLLASILCEFRLMTAGISVDEDASEPSVSPSPKARP